MNKVENLEREIQGFSPSELAAFRKWFREFDAEAWDCQIEEDIHPTFATSQKSKLNLL